MEFSILTYCQPKQRINKIPSTRTDTPPPSSIQISKKENEDSIFSIVWTVYFSRSIPFRRQRWRRRRTSHVSKKRCLNRKCHQCSSFVGAATTVTWTPVPKLRQRVRFLLLVHRVASTTKDVCTRTQCRCQTTKWNNEQNTRAEHEKKTQRTNVHLWRKRRRRCDDGDEDGIWL